MIEIPNSGSIIKELPPRYEHYFMRECERHSFWLEKPENPKGKLYTICILKAPDFPGEMNPDSENLTVACARQFDDGYWS